MAMNNNQMKIAEALEKIATQQAEQKRLPKFEIKEIENKSEWDDWFYSLQVQIATGLPTLWAKIINALKEATLAAGQLVIDTCDAFEKKCYEGATKAVSAKIKGAAQTLCTQAGANTLYPMLRVLQAAFGRDLDVDKVGLHRSFMQDKWRPAKESLIEWCSRKFHICQKIPDFIPASAIEANMRSALLNLLPPHFETVAAQLRANPPKTWQEIQSRLLDWDRSQSGKEKCEHQGSNSTTSLLLEVPKWIMAGRNRQEFIDAFWSRPGPPYNNWDNSGSGYSVQGPYDRPSNGKDWWRGGGKKGGKKGKGKKGQGKGKKGEKGGKGGKGNPDKHKQCYFCYEWGHITTNCTKLKKKNEKKNNNEE